MHFTITQLVVFKKSPVQEQFCVLKLSNC